MTAGLGWVNRGEPMTDRLKGCTVLFNQDVRTDDAEALLNAIQMLKGVQAVNPNVLTDSDWMARERVRGEFVKDLWQVLHPGTKQ